MSYFTLIFLAGMHIACATPRKIKNRSVWSLMNFMYHLCLVSWMIVGFILACIWSDDVYDIHTSWSLTTNIFIQRIIFFFCNRGRNKNSSTLSIDSHPSLRTIVTLFLKHFPKILTDCHLWFSFRFFWGDFCFSNQCKPESWPDFIMGCWWICPSADHIDLSLDQKKQFLSMRK